MAAARVPYNDRFLKFPSPVRSPGSRKSSGPATRSSFAVQTTARIRKDTLVPLGTPWAGISEQTPNLWFEAISTMGHSALAVDTRHQGKGAGKTLLFDALTRTEEAADVVAVRAAMVHPIEDGATDSEQARDHRPIHGRDRGIFPRRTGADPS